MPSKPRKRGSGPAARATWPGPATGAGRGPPPRPRRVRRPRQRPRVAARPSRGLRAAADGSGSGSAAGCGDDRERRRRGGLREITNGPSPKAVSREFTRCGDVTGARGPHAGPGHAVLRFTSRVCTTRRAHPPPARRTGPGPAAVWLVPAQWTPRRRGVSRDAAPPGRVRPPGGNVPASDSSTTGPLADEPVSALPPPALAGGAGLRLPATRPRSAAAPRRALRGRLGRATATSPGHRLPPGAVAARRRPVSWRTSDPAGRPGDRVESTQ